MGEAPAFLVDDPPKDSSTGQFFPSAGPQTVTIIGDKRYVIDGEDDGPVSSIGVKISDKFTKEGLSLTVLGTKPKPCKSHSAVALNDDRILVLSRNSSPEESFWFLEVDTKFVREQKKKLKTEVVSWSKGVVGDTEKLIVISGPSGVGKGTLISKLMKEFTSMFGFSVSHTTRAPRQNEMDGVHYHFIRRNTMEEEIEMGKFLEFANVHGNLYGTSVEAVQAVANAGKRCILDIDVQGARSVRASSLEAFFIFICPPSMEELEKRLRARGTETDEQIEKRVKNASKELEDANSPGLFDHFLQNDDLEKCYNDLKKLLGLEGSAIATHKSSMEMSNLHRDHSVSGHRFVIRNQEPDKASKSQLHLDASSLKGGSPGRTRGLKLYSTDSFSHDRNGI